jgi:apolipoprotein D and lipocalin family protein
MREAEGIAHIVDSNTNAKLKVSFYWPFFGSYWIINIGENYEYAVVSEPKRQYLSK